MSSVPGFLLLMGLHNPKPVRHWASDEAVFRVMKGEGDRERRKRSGQKGKNEEGRGGDETKPLRSSLANSADRAWAVSQAGETRSTWKAGSLRVSSLLTLGRQGNNHKKMCKPPLAPALGH